MKGGEKQEEASALACNDPAMRLICTGIEHTHLAAARPRHIRGRQ
jgi:hypothetical protein